MPRKLRPRGVLAHQPALQIETAVSTNSATMLWRACESWVCGIDLAKGALVWLTTFAGQRLPRQTMLREIRLALGYAPRYFAEFNLVVHLLCEYDGTLSVLAFDAVTGAPRWRTSIPIPAPAPFTESRDLPELLETETIRAFIVQRDDQVTLALNRHARRSAMWTPERHFPAPPWGARIDLIELKAANGVIARRHSLADAVISFWEVPYFDGLHVANGLVYDFDWRMFRTQQLMEVDGERPEIACVGDRVHVASRAPGRILLAGCDRRGGGERRATLRKTGIKQLRVTNDMRGCSIVCNDTRVIPLDKVGEPMSELKVPPYVYKVLRSSDSTIFIHCSGRGNRLFAFDLPSGAVKFTQTEFEGADLHQRGGDGELISVANGRILRYSSAGRALSALPCDVAKGAWVGDRYIFGSLTKPLADGHEMAVFDFP